MPKRVTKAMRRLSRKQLPKIVRQVGEEIVAEVRPPTENLGEVMPIELMKGKVPAEEQPELIVWNNRQIEQ